MPKYALLDVLFSAIILFILAQALCLAAPVELFVAPQGNDAWTGRTEQPRAPNGPFATLARAADELRRLNASGALRDGAVVNVLPGTYYLAEPLRLGPEHCDKAQAPIVFRGVGKEKPVLCGGKVLSGFRRYKGNIVVCDMAANGLAGRKIGQLFFAGRRQILARYPNRDPNDPHGGRWAHVARVEPGGSHTVFFHGPDEQHNWAHPEDGSVSIFAGYDWAFRIVPLARYDPKQRKIVLAKPTWGSLRVGDRYFVRGLFEELDAPGEWYLNPRTRKLYFWPPKPFSAGPVVAPVADNVVVLRNAHQIRFQGFVIEVCNSDGVRIENSRDCQISACVVRNAGGYGIVVSGGANNAALGNDVYWCGHGGISISGGDRKTLTPAGNVADNNYVHHCENIWKTYRPGVNIRGVGNRASHNLIHDMPHAGILLSGNENIVEYNIVHHVNLESADTGGIYFCSRDWTQRGNVIRYNIFHHCGGFGKTSPWAPVKNGKVQFEYPHFTFGIYLDDPTTGTLVYGNILYAVPIVATHNHGGRDNTWENNIIIDCPAFRAGMLSPTWSEWPKIYDRLKAMLYPGSPYPKRYPKLTQIQDTHPEEMSGLRFVRNIVYYSVEGTKWIRQKRGKSWGGEDIMQLYSVRMRKEDFPTNIWDYNCIYAEPGIEVRIDLTLVPEKRKWLTWEQWRALGADKHSTFADPLFVSLAKRDFRLKPNSPALALGFKPIPVEKIGPYADPHRATWPIREAPGAAALGEFTTIRYYEVPQ